MNADNMSADALQPLMQHKDYQTTQRYINMARQLTPAVHKLFCHVPTLAAAERRLIRNRLGRLLEGRAVFRPRIRRPTRIDVTVS